MTLTNREKELVTVGISLAAGCRPCTNYHLRAVREEGASETEIEAALTIASQVRKQAAERMEDWALARLHGEKRENQPDDSASLDRVQELVRVGAAFAVNCTESLVIYRANAEQAGATQEEILEVAERACFVTKMAESHVRKAVGLKAEQDVESGAATESHGSCC